MNQSKFCNLTRQSPTLMGSSFEIDSRSYSFTVDNVSFMHAALAIKIYAIDKVLIQRSVFSRSRIGRCYGPYSASIQETYLRDPVASSPYIIYLNGSHRLSVVDHTVYGRTVSLSIGLFDWTDLRILWVVTCEIIGNNFAKNDVDASSPWIVYMQTILVIMLLRHHV